MKKCLISLLHNFRTIFVIKLFYGMPKPMRFISPLLLSAFCILLFCCGKEEPSPTVIKGTVSDRKTGAPIEGAKFLIGFDTEANNTTLTKYIDFTTDANGAFAYTEDSDYGYVNGGSNVDKPGYVTNHTFASGIFKGKENDLNITLLPRDAILKIVVLNQSGVQTPFYFLMNNPEEKIESGGLVSLYYLKEKPLNLMQGESYSQYFKLPESRNYISWDTQPFTLGENASFKDTIWVYSNDTIEYSIIY